MSWLSSISSAPSFYTYDIGVMHNYVIWLTVLHCVFQPSGGIVNQSVIIRINCNYQMHSIGSQIAFDL